MAQESRRPLLVSTLGASGFLGLVQAGLLILLNQSVGGPELAAGVARLGIVAGFLTMLVLLPLALLVRRWQAEWPGDRLRASWAACFGLAAAVAGFIVGEPCAAGVGLGGRARLAAGFAVAAVVGWGASFLQPPRRWLNGWAIGSVVLLLACFVPYPPPPDWKKAAARSEAQPTAAAGADAPDVVLISIDALRADRLGVYGRSPSLTPEIDRLAGEGAVFERALAAAPWTTPSVASLLTGLPVIQHQAGLPLGSGSTFLRSPLDGSLTTLAERFEAAGYRTRAVVTNGLIGAHNGFAQGFDEFRNPSEGSFLAMLVQDLPLFRVLVALLPPQTWGDGRAETVTNQALAWLGEASPRPLFLWLHYQDTHMPLRADPAAPVDLSAVVDTFRQPQPPRLPDGTVVGHTFIATELVRGGMLWLGPEDRRRLISYYDRAVRYADKHVGRLLDALRERRAQRRVIVVLTADHGEEFWDHGYFEHGHDYYREVTWVPLVFWAPDVVLAGRRVKTLAGLVDIAPTLLELAGFPVPAPASPEEGRSLLALLTGGAEDDKAPPRFCGGNLYGLPAVLMQEGELRCILRANEVLEVYDVTRDPHERNNLASARADLASACVTVLRPRLGALMHSPQRAGPMRLSLEQIEALRALGYVR